MLDGLDLLHHLVDVVAHLNGWLGRSEDTLVTLLLSVDMAASWSGGEEGGGSDIFLVLGSKAFLVMGSKAFLVMGSKAFLVRAGLQEADTVGLGRELIGVSWPSPRNRLLTPRLAAV